MTIHPSIRPRPGIAGIAPYQGGAAHAPGANRSIKLSANENPLGPSPLAVEAYRSVAGNLAVYPDGGAVRLRTAIARAHGIEPERIVCGAGSDELIALLCQAYAGEGDEVLYSAHGFLMYRLSALAAGATPVPAPERDLTTDIDALIARATPRTRLVFLANPNNPTGTMVPESALARLADALPPTALLVLDAAYAEYIRTPGYDGGLGLAGARENVVTTRTFSKIHGLAALRLGWAYGPAHVIDVLNRVRGPFNVTAPALAAGEAAVADREHVARSAVLNEVWRDWLAGEIRAVGLGVTPSHGNFLLIEAGDRVAEFDAHLAAHGLIGRRVDGYGLPGHYRLSIGDEAACRAVADALAAWPATASAPAPAPRAVGTGSA
ncbi:MAG: pyridoxal phosphate-dependent aminotransferase [Paracoccaceae bacterium]